VVKSLESAPLLRCVVALLLVLASGAGARAQGAAPAPGMTDADFVRVVEGRFQVGGMPFRFLGANAAVVHGPEARRSVDEVLDAVAADGLRVVRVWALGEAPVGAPSYQLEYAFRIGDSGWVEPSFAHLDRVIAAAKARNLRVVVVLANRWKDYGGFAQYSRWANPEVPLSPDGNLRSTQIATLLESARFAELYRAHVERIVLRTNTITGGTYKDDPTILAWELVNESSSSTVRGGTALVAWTDRMATEIHRLDPNHLVGAGHVGYDTESDRAVWLRTMSLASIDYADAHLYPLGDSRVTNESTLRAYVDDRIALAHRVLRKPLVIGEFGFDATSAERHGRSRDAWTERFVSHLERRGVAGAMVWIYESAREPRRRHSIGAGTSLSPNGDGVRSVMRTAARRVVSDRPPSMDVGGDEPTAPIFVSRGLIRGVRLPLPRWVSDDARATLGIDLVSFVDARFEIAGVYLGGERLQLWGRGDGAVRFAFRAPPRVPRTFAFRATMSSELDGDGVGAGPEDDGEVEVRIDDIPIGRVRLPTDDGRGVALGVVSTDSALLARIFPNPGRNHVLTLVAPSDHGAGGLCLYGPRMDGTPAPTLLERIELVVE